MNPRFQLRGFKKIATQGSNIYDHWFASAVDKGLKDIAERRVLSVDESRQRDAARRAGLANRIGRTR